MNTEPLDSDIEPTTKLTYGDLRAHARRVAAKVESIADPLPGALRTAFAGDGESIHGIHVRAPVAADFPILKQIDSPLYRQSLEMSKPKEIRAETPFTEEDGWEMFYQFTRPVAEVREQLHKHGRERFRATAIQIGSEVADRINPFVFNLVIAAINRQYIESFQTAIGYKSEGEGGTVFTQPPADQTTGSVGGSTSSPSSPSNAGSAAAK